MYITLFIANYVLGWFFLTLLFSCDAMDGAGGRVGPSEGRVPWFLDCDIRCCLYNQVCAVSRAVALTAEVST